MAGYQREFPLSQRIEDAGVAKWPLLGVLGSHLPGTYTEVLAQPRVTSQPSLIYQLMDRNGDLSLSLSVFHTKLTGQIVRSEGS